MGWIAQGVAVRQPAFLIDPTGSSSVLFLIYKILKSETCPPDDALGNTLLLFAEDLMPYGMGQGNNARFSFTVAQDPIAQPARKTDWTLAKDYPCTSREEVLLPSMRASNVDPCLVARINLALASMW